MKRGAVIGRRSLKEERLEARLTPEQKKLIAQAAALRGTSVTEFVVASAQEAATQAIKDYEILSLSGEARKVFVNAVLNPPVPNEAARKAARRYREQMGLWLSSDPEQHRFVIEPLGPKHDRAAFSCGVQILNAYLHRQAGQDLRKRVAVPFVLTPDGSTIAGYYTLSQYAVQLDVIPPEEAKNLPKYPVVPTTLIGRLAVSVSFRGQGLDASLLMDALHRSLTYSREIASAGVIVDAKDPAAVAFYRKYGFLQLPRIERRLFLPMGTVEELFR
jgi:uncharacterized protein (DUF1778 family)/predicted GNAT family N-acyltransferase